MQFLPNDDGRPRRIARHLRSELACRGIKLDGAACLEAVAQACGHETWQGMRRRIGRASATPLDDESDAPTVTARRELQESVLRKLGLDAAKAADVAESLRITARKYGRTSLSAARVTFLDVPWTSMEQLSERQAGLMSEILERERVMNVHRKAAGFGPDALDSFMRTIPENVAAVASRFVDAPYEVTFGLLMFVGSLSRSHEEADVWVATLQELWRRLDGRTVGMGHFVEAFAPGIPTEAAVAGIWERRSAGERTTGMPRFDMVIPDGSIGLMVNGMRRKPYVVSVPSGEFDAFMERHETMFEDAPADPTIEEEANLGLQVELLKENVALEDGDPELAKSAGILLWLALVHPDRGQQVRDAIDAALDAGAAYVTLTVSDTLKVRTSVSNAFEDRARIFW